MILTRRMLLWLLLAACNVPLCAQAGLEWMTGRSWRMRDGLPDQVVQAIAQTPDHYLWLGTKLGLVRFDGTHFLDFHAPGVHALQDFGVGCILVGRDSSLWLGTQGGGVVHLTGDRGHTYSASEGLENGLVRALYEDEAGHIWAGTDHGLFRMDSARPGGRFTRVNDRLAFADWGVHAIIGDGNGGVWVGGSRLLHFFREGASEKPWAEEELPAQPTSVRIWSMARAPDGALWIASLGGLLHKAVGQPVLPDKRISRGTLSLLIDHNQRLWVGTLGDGLLLINPDGSLSHAMANPQSGQAGNNAVLALTEDKAQDLWVGTQSGLARFSTTGMHLTHIPGAVDADFGSVAVDADKSLWVCSRELLHMHGTTPQPASLPGLHGIAIRAVMRDRFGAFWVGSSGSGVYRITRDGHTDHYTSEIGTNYIRGFLETKNDGIWIASDGGVANWRDGHVTTYQNAAGSPHAPVTAMAAGAPGELWVGTYQGLSLLRNGTYVPSTTAGRHTVWALHHSDDGTLWMGTENGLFLWRNGQSEALHVDLKEDMGGSAILSILEDDRGRIWLGGRTSVLRAKRSALEDIAANKNAAFTPEIFAVSRETGTELSGGSGSVADLDGDGGAWFASHDGPLHILGADTSAVGEPPPVTLRQVSVDGQHVNVQGTLTLQPSAKTLEIDAAPISLSSRPGLQLRRRLVGFDTDWLPAGTQPATYTNLPPGNYTYRVEASWRGSPEVSTLELPIVQRTHFYRRPVFVFACVALLVALAWLIHEIRVRQMKLRFRVTAEERNRMAREIHDTVVQGCIGVSSLLEAVAIRQSPDAPHDGLLDTAREQIALTIVEARDAIWDLRHASHNDSLAHSLRAMLDRMTASRNAIVSFDVEGEATPLDRTAEHELLMSVREALHNAMTHAAPSHIALILHYDVSTLTVSIRDDGRGFEPADAQPTQGMHFGLLGMQERMERISGSCTINSVPGRGAEVLLQLPIRHSVSNLQDAP